MSQVYKASAQKIIEYEAGGTIVKGQGVMVSGATTEKNPVPSTSLTRNIPTVTACTLSDPARFQGVALEGASSGNKVKVCIEGVCKGYFDTGHNIAAGDYLTIVESAGEFGECATTTAVSCAIAMEADSSTTEGDLLDIYLPPRTIDIGQ